MENLIEKLKAVEVNPRYEIGYDDMQQIKNHSEDLFETMRCAFKFGYLQGGKAAKAEIKRVQSERIPNPKYKNEYRQEIIWNVYNTKDSIALQDVYIITDLLRRMVDDVEYSTHYNPKKEGVH